MKPRKTDLAIIGKIQGMISTLQEDLNWWGNGMCEPPCVVKAVTAINKATKQRTELVDTVAVHCRRQSMKRTGRHVR